MSGYESVCGDMSYQSWYKLELVEFLYELVSLKFSAIRVSLQTTQYAW